jgi:hypothetical protein
VKRIVALLLSTVLLWGVAHADEAPISGTIKAIDPAASTLTIARTVKGKTSDVVIDIKPTSKIVRFAKSSEAGTTGFVEQPIALAELKPGWVVSVTARHEGHREVAEVVKVVFER